MSWLLNCLSSVFLVKQIMNDCIFIEQNQIKKVPYRKEI